MYCIGFLPLIFLIFLSQAKSEEQLACEKEWLQTGHMWLAHRGGFTAVVREGDGDGGRVRVRVLGTGEELTVDEDDLEKVCSSYLVDRRGLILTIRPYLSGLKV